MTDSNRTRSRRKAAKRRPGFPLYRHASGHWAKKVRGQTRYFGKTAEDPNGKAALELWLDRKDDLLAGRQPRDKTDCLTVGELANRFLTHKAALRDHGELSPRTFQTYHATCATLVKAFGKNRVVIDLTPDDFRILRGKLSKTRAMVSLRNEMQRVRSVFKYAFDEGLILAPIRFGQSFAKPKLEAVRRAREAHRAEHGDRMFEAPDLRAILRASKQPLEAMTLLAANAGFGQADISALPIRAVDLKKAWVDFPRPKTGVPRRIPLWPETVASIRDWLKTRPAAKDKADEHLLFLTCRGARWVKSSAATETKSGGAPIDGIGQEFGKVLRKTKLKRPGRSFYGIRHGVETIGGELGDQVALDAIMGHVPRGMGAHYRERISDERLSRIVEHIRQWLFEGDGDDPRDQRQGDTRRAKRAVAFRPASRRTVSGIKAEETFNRPLLRIVG